MTINKDVHNLKPSISFSRNVYSSEYQFKSSATYVPQPQLQPQQGWNDNVYNQGFNETSPLQTNRHGTCEITNYDWSLPSHSFNYNEPSLHVNTVDFLQSNPVPVNTYQVSNGYYQQSNNYQTSFPPGNQEYIIPNQRYTTPISGKQNFNKIKVFQRLIK